MALINCPECGRQISDRAPSCPGCGILKEDIQAILAEQNAAHGSMEEKKKSNNNDVSEPQGTKEEFVGYPTISAISESERTQYSENYGTKSEDAEPADKMGLKEDQFKPDTIKAGETIQFGSYAGEPIEWIVLKTYRNRAIDRALLLSKYILDVGSYHSISEFVTWNECDLREYLNREFIKAFSPGERKRILTVSNENADNEEYQSLGGKITDDQIFCMSIDEVKEYLLNENLDVGAKLTEYAAQRARELFKGEMDEFQYFQREDTDEAEWWLRSPGEDNESAAMVTVNALIEKKKLFHTEYEKAPSQIDECGRYVTDIAGIRPAFWLCLE